MIRVLLTILLPLVLPTALYLLWLATARRSALAGPAPWRSLPWVWLGLIGVVLTAALLYFVGTHMGSAPQGTYVPPRYIDGRIEPGHIVPAEPSRR
jgi:hypothetical protein